MKIIWSESALRDVDRLREFLLPLSVEAANRFLVMIVAAPDRLVLTPRLGERVDRPGNEEIRRIFAGDYEVRYEIARDDVYIVRVWHTRENR